MMFDRFAFVFFSDIVLHLQAHFVVDYFLMTETGYYKLYCKKFSMFF